MFEMCSPTTRRRWTSVEGCRHRSESGNYLRNELWVIVLVTILSLLGSITGVDANIMDERCDWTGNGLSVTASPSQSRGVTPVYLRCSEGRVTWSYPRGALRVLLRLPGSGKDFKGCIKVAPEFSGARLFLEGQRLLVPLFSLNDGGHKQLVRCFQSTKGQAAIYVEAADYTGDFRREVASFSYDLYPIPKGATVMDLINDECRPCTAKELAHAFCTSDLVTRGSIDSIDDKLELEVAQVNVRVTKVLRHSTDDNLLSSNLVSHSNGLATLKTHDIVRLHMARHCSPQHGPGEFVFMGRRRLGELSLVCVSNLVEWADTVRTMNADGSSQCVLTS